MLKIKLLFISLFISLIGFSQNSEYIFKFKVPDKSELKTLTKIISIDNYKDGTVTAYANESEFAEFKKLGYDFEIQTHPSAGKSIVMATTVAQMANWDRYPTYDVYIQMMNKFATDYPDLCQVINIGTSEDGRQLIAVKISDNISSNENEPEFLYTSSMHGDEVTGMVLMLRLIDYLLTNYNKDQFSTDLVNNIEIYINPDSNPDGTYAGGNNSISGATRYNSNGVDLNRNFPTIGYTSSDSDENEIAYMIDFAEAHNFIMSANFHGGAEVMNFPWDYCITSENIHADDSWFRQISNSYVASARVFNSGYMTDVVSSGVTQGGDWYTVDGSRQDNMTYYHNCREITIEISSNKMLDCEELGTYWNYNKNSFLNYMKESLNGIRGIVVNSSETPLDATISITGHDQANDNSQVVSDQVAGNYHRLIDNGTYNVTYAVSGFSNITVNNVAVTDGNATIMDIMFGGNFGTVTLTGTITNQKTGAPINNAHLVITGETNNYSVYTNVSGQYSVSNVTCGTYKFDMSADGYMDALHWESVLTSDANVSKVLVPYLMLSGTVTEAANGNPIQGATVEILNTSFETLTTDVDGEYFVYISEGTYDIKASKSGYAPVITNAAISESNNVVDFELEVSVAISFETEIPAGWTFTNTPWTRSNDDAYEGDWSMKSGNISDNGISVMQVSKACNAGTISFFKKVSSESGYDYLKFYIDGTQQGSSWSGEVAWSEENFSVTAGTHTFKWEYSKDSGVDDGSDCAWVDYVTLPPTQTFTVTFNVKCNSIGVEGANVSLTGYGTQTTNASGVATFTGVQAAASPGISYSVSSTGYELASGNVIVDGNETVNVSLTEVTEEYSITFVVKDNLENLIDGALITLTGFTPQSTVSGQAIFENIPYTPTPGIEFTVTKTGFNNLTDFVIVDNNKTVNVQITPETVIVENTASEFNVYPNPSNGKFYINNTTGDVFSYVIINQIGQIINISEKANNNITEIDLSEYSKGLYFIRITTGKQTFFKPLTIY